MNREAYCHCSPRSTNAWDGKVCAECGGAIPESWKRCHWSEVGALRATDHQETTK